MGIISVRMGEIRAAAAPDQLQTVLGSCVGLALFDRQAGVAGLAHIMLPDADRAEPPQPGKFAASALPALIALLVRGGAARGRLQAKIAGGAAMFKTRPGCEALLDIGLRNTRRVKELLKAEGITVLAEHCGGGKGRKILLDPATGLMTVEVMGLEKEEL